MSSPPPRFPSLLLFVCLLSINITHLSNGSDSITPAQPLYGTQTITSEGGRFELGFFSPSNYSQNYYIGIWYEQIPEQTVVWVANRETPLSNTNNSVLKISEHGNLVLLSPSNASIWSTNLTSTAPSNSTVAILLDSGNLVLRDGTNPSVVHWQSFDHPTDTFLPGNWIGLNKATGENKRLTSWKSDEDPGPGRFSFEIDPNQSRFLMLWNGTQRYWNGGFQDGEEFSGIVGMGSGFRTDFGFVDNETGKYFSYYLHDPSTFLRSVMDASGQLKQFFWVEGSDKWILYSFQPRFQCDVHVLCGAFGSCKERTNLSSFYTCLPGFIPKVEKDWDLGRWSDGCMRRTPLQLAENSKSDVETDSAGECNLACLNNPSCTAYAFESGCLIWKGDLVNFQQLSDEDVNGKTLFLRLSASEVPKSRSRKRTRESLERLNVVKKWGLQSKRVLTDVFLDCGNAQIGTVVAEPEEDEREFGAQQPHLHRREYGLGNGMYYFVIAAAAVTCSKPLPQTAETLQLRHLQRKQAVCRNAGLKTRSRFPRNSSVESVTHGCLLWGLSVGSRFHRDSGQAIDFLFLVLLSETFYYLYNTHLSEPHLFVAKAEREECIVVAELRDRFS
ncbi:hypothetical protein ACLOJK_020597 [Asimina triloba]